MMKFSCKVGELTFSDCSLLISRSCQSESLAARDISLAWARLLPRIHHPLRNSRMLFLIASILPASGFKSECTFLYLNFLQAQPSLIPGDITTLSCLEWLSVGKILQYNCCDFLNGDKLALSYCCDMLTLDDGLFGLAREEAQCIQWLTISTLRNLIHRREQTADLIAELLRLFEFFHASVNNADGFQLRSEFDVWGEVCCVGVCAALLPALGDLQSDKIGALTAMPMTMSMISSSNWQFELVGLLALHWQLLRRESSAEAVKAIPQSTATTVAPSLSTTKGKVTRVRGSVSAGGDTASKKDSKGVKARADSSRQIINPTKDSQKSVTTESVSRIGHEITRSGGLRHIGWGMLSRRWEIRRQSYEVLRSLLGQGEGNQLDCEHCIGIIEQGVLPLLEVISNGMPSSCVDSLESIPNPSALDEMQHDWMNWGRRVQCCTGMEAEREGSLVDNVIFPEFEIRDLATQLINRVGNTLSTELNALASAAEARPVPRAKDPTTSSSSRKSSTQPVSKPKRQENVASRLINAMFYAGNTKLRCNIFVGILLLSSRDENLGRQLWGIDLSDFDFQTKSSEQRQNDSVFAVLLERLGSNSDDLRSVVLLPLIHLLAVSLTTLPLVEPFPQPTSTTSATSGPTVAVRSKLQMQKMLCPPPSDVVRHSPMLASILQSELDRQSQMWQEQKFTESVRSTDLAKFISSIPLSELFELEGSYEVWQEIFSHMTDAFLLKNSLPRMSERAVMEAFRISRRFRIHGLLAAYADALTSRLNWNNIFQIFECALDLSLETHKVNPVSVHTTSRRQPQLSLTLSCLVFLNENLDTAPSLRLAKIQSDMAQCLYFVIESIVT